MKTKAKQRGIVLIVVLIMLAIFTVIVVSMLTGSNINFKIAGNQGAILLRTQFAACDAARGRAGGAHHFISRHDHFHGASRLFGQHHRQGFKIDDGLAAKTTTDFSRNDLDLGGVQAAEPGCECAHHELALT